MAPRFSPPASIERKFAIELRKIARHIGQIVNMHAEGAEIKNAPALQKILASYSAALEPWAMRTTTKVLTAIATANRRDFFATAKAISKELRNTLADSSVGVTVRQLQADQVALIKSLPIEAGQRAQELALQATTGGKRADEVALEIARTGEVTESRATLIARTEISKANAAITQTRAQAAGTDQYIWRTMEDADVRESHAEMDGVVCNFSNPPTLSDGTTGNAGEFPNCRCYAEPLFTK